jgi:hypothetical protein
MSTIGPIFEALNKGLGIWDFYNKTKYQRQYKKLIDEIKEEEAKPLYGDQHRKFLRDQNVIDRAQHEISMLLHQFLGEPDDYKNNQD